MNIYHIAPLHLLYYRETITVTNLYSILERNIAASLQQEAVKNQLLITGPVYWTYFGLSNDEHKPFTLEVGVPVQGIPNQYEGSFGIKTTAEFKCVSTIHIGDWMKLPETYGELMQYITSNNLIASGENRELYINANFDNPDANITLVQIGIQ